MATSAPRFTPEEQLLRKHEDRSAELRALFICLIPLSTTAVLLRFLARRVARTKLWWDDWLTVVALIFAIALNIVLLLAVDHGGLGLHAEFAGKIRIIYGLKILFASEIIYQLSMTFIKIAILLFFYRLFKVHLNFVIALWVIGTVTLCWYFSSTFVIIFQCEPVVFLWNRTIKGGQCLEPHALWIGSSVTSFLTDVAILCLPMPMIWGLKAQRNQKIALTGVFLLGAFVCITSIIRLSTIKQLSLTDQSWSYVPAAIWTSVECSVAVISACLPTLKPLFRTIFDLTDVLPFDHSTKRSDEEAGISRRSTSPDPTRQWRAHANAQRICELGEVKSEDHKSAQTSPTLTCGAGDSDEKRWGRNYSRPWMGLKTSYESLKPMPNSRAHEFVVGRGAKGVEKEKMLPAPPPMQARVDSPHLVGKDGRRANDGWKLPNFEFEQQSRGSVISVPSPMRHASPAKARSPRRPRRP